MRNREGISHSLEYNCLSFERSLNENLCGVETIPGNMGSNNGDNMYFDIMNFITALLTWMDVWNYGETTVVMELRKWCTDSWWLKQDNINIQNSVQRTK